MILTQCDLPLMSAVYKGAQPSVKLHLNSWSDICVTPMQCKANLFPCLMLCPICLQSFEKCFLFQFVAKMLMRWGDSSIHWSRHPAHWRLTPSVILQLEDWGLDPSIHWPRLTPSVCHWRGCHRLVRTWASRHWGLSATIGCQPSPHSTQPASTLGWGGNLTNIFVDHIYFSY